ncbi:MAG: type II secretion system protein GspG [Planctomycetota bacterium]|jgi:hypothetical protein
MTSSCVDVNSENANSSPAPSAGNSANTAQDSVDAQRLHKLNLAKWKLAQVEMSEIGKAILMYVLDNDGDRPNSLKDLTESFPNGIPRDPFTKSDYVYETVGDGHDFKLICLGSDNAVGGKASPEADILVTKRGLSGQDE